ncbi:MAG: DUF4142 domain-containing protein [Bauldia sp.]
MQRQSFPPLTVIAAAALALGAGSAQTLAQTPPVPPAAQAPLPDKAADFVRKAANAGDLEVQSSELASTKAQRDDVKQFAQRMVADHKTAGDKLKALAKTLNLEVPAALDAEHQQMLQNVQAASGANFDRAYVEMQVSAHQSAVDLFGRYSQGGDNPQLKQFAAETLPTLQDHLRMVTQLRSVVSTATRADAGVANPQLAAGQISVQQPGPSIRVDQPPAQVTVQQVPPNVTVRQAQPEIVVRQPAPTITIDIPQPEITVRMPQPEVNVAQAQPQVQIAQPQPQIRVEGGNGPAAAKVDVQRNGEPTVRFERAEAQVKVNQPDTQPQVHFEQLAAAGEAKAPAEGAANAAATPTTPTPTLDRNGAAPTATVVPTRSMPVGDLRGVDVVDQRGNKLGDVAQLIVGGDDTIYVIVAYGGFLGIGEKRVALPLQSLAMNASNKLVAPSMTNEQLSAMNEWKPAANSYRDLTSGQVAVPMP